MTITKAIIPVAGWGTRRLPITKTIEKCMLPVGNRPIVDYVVQDCIAAGITDIYFIVGENSTQLHDFYRSNIDLNDYLRRNGKESLLPLIAPPKVRLHYIVQSSYEKYGTAVPVDLAIRAIGLDEPVVVLMGDDFIYNPDGESGVKQLIDATPEGSCSLIGIEALEDELSQYGVIDMNDAHEFLRIVEKPSAGEAPSNLINVSKYVLNPEMLRAVHEYVKQDRETEYYITDPINGFVQAGGVVKVVPVAGRYLDGGTAESWLQANKVVIEGA